MLKGCRGRRDVTNEGRALSKDESRSLLQACGGPPKGIREQLILALGIGSGLRRTEIAPLRLKAIDEKTPQIKILGKDNKQRTIYPSKHRNLSVIVLGYVVTTAVKN